VRTTFEVMQAVKDGTEATDEELRYALRNVECWYSLHMMDIARGATEEPVSDKTRRGLRRAWDNWQSGNKVPLDVRLKGSSMEPGISREERADRRSARTADAVVKFASALNSLAGRQKP
jgi:hypothetical protein